MQSLQYSCESSDIDESSCGEQNSRMSSTCSRSKGCSFPTSSNSAISSCKQAICRKCHDEPEKVFETDANLFAECIDYLRSSVMIPLSWATAKALRYRPSDPKHYIACQLLRWHYGNVSTKEQNGVKEFVIGRTMKMDEKFIQQQCQIGADVMSECNKEAVTDILSQFCRQNRVHRGKERSWKCMKECVYTYEPWNFLDYRNSSEADSPIDSKTNSSTTPAYNHVQSEDSSFQ